MINLLSDTAMLNSIIQGAIISAAISAGVWLIQQFRYFLFLYCKFNNAVFLSFRKNDDGSPVHEITFKVRGNKIIFFGKRLKDGDEHEGQVIINPINLKTGEGYYFHKKAEGFAFPKIMIKDRKTIFVEAPFSTFKNVDKDHPDKKEWVRRSQAFVWKKKDKRKQDDDPSIIRSTDNIQSPTGAAAL